MSIPFGPQPFTGDDLLSAAQGTKSKTMDCLHFAPGPAIAAGV